MHVQNGSALLDREIGEPEELLLTVLGQRVNEAKGNPCLPHGIEPGQELAQGPRRIVAPMKRGRRTAQANSQVIHPPPYSSQPPLGEQSAVGRHRSAQALRFGMCERTVEAPVEER